MPTDQHSHECLRYLWDLRQLSRHQPAISYQSLVVIASLGFQVHGEARERLKTPRESWGSLVTASNMLLSAVLVIFKGRRFELFGNEDWG